MDLDGEMNGLPTPVIFRVRKFDYNRYSVHHELARGIINFGSIVTDVMEPPNSPTQDGPMDEPPLAVQSTNIMSFVNLGKKNTPSQPVANADLPDTEKIDITGSISDEDRQEPWNEYVLAKDPPLILRTKSTLVKAVVYPNVYNALGDPLLLIKHSDTHSVHESVISDIDLG